MAHLDQHTFFHFQLICIAMGIANIETKVVQTVNQANFIICITKRIILKQYCRF